MKGIRTSIILKQKKKPRAATHRQKGEQIMLFYINTIMDLIDIYNTTTSEEYKQIDIFDVLDDIDNLDDEEDIKRAIKELEARI